MDNSTQDIMERQLWRRGGWTARVVRNEEDHGWAVEMIRAGDSEPVLVGPWTMGRDKKNPKPLDQSAFTVLVKTANEVMARHEQHAKAMLHKTWVHRREDGQPIRVQFDIIPDEDDPHGLLICTDDLTGEMLRQGRVSPKFKLNAKSVEHFLLTGDA